MNDRITLQAKATPSREEIMAANFLIEKDKKAMVRFLAVSGDKGVRTPDIRMNNLNWEIKCPIGKSAATIKRAFKTAFRQSPNIVFDLRHSKMPDKVNIPKLEKEFYDIKGAKRLIIITKACQKLDFEK
jgi:hypothetical protein